MTELKKLQEEFDKRKEIALGDRNIMRGILNDCLYDDKAKVNQLLATFDCGIVEKIVSEHNPNGFFVHRMITELENDYGFPQETCGWVVERWIELLHGGKIIATLTTTINSVPKQTPLKMPQETVKVSEKPKEEPKDYNAILEIAKNSVTNGDYQQAEKTLKTIIMNTKEENICIQANFYLGLMYDRQKVTAQ